MVQAEQMKVCMLKSLLLYASSSFKSHIILRGCGGRGESSSRQHRVGGGGPCAPARLLPVEASSLGRRAQSGRAARASPGLGPGPRRGSASLLCAPQSGRPAALGPARLAAVPVPLGARGAPAAGSVR